MFTIISLRKTVYRNSGTGVRPCIDVISGSVLFTANDRFHYFCEAYGYAFTNTQRMRHTYGFGLSCSVVTYAALFTFTCLELVQVQTLKYIIMIKCTNRIERVREIYI